jgi:hypothetical protein
MTSKESQLPQIELDETIQGIRRTERQSKPSPRYANATLVDKSMPIEPSSYQEAAKGPKWRKAIGVEIKAQMRIKHGI